MHTIIWLTVVVVLFLDNRHGGNYHSSGPITLDTFVVVVFIVVVEAVFSERQRLFNVILKNENLVSLNLKNVKQVMHTLKGIES